jgi:hypothetical protein
MQNVNDQNINTISRFATDCFRLTVQFPGLSRQLITVHKETATCLYTQSTTSIKRVINAGAKNIHFMQELVVLSMAGRTSETMVRRYRYTEKLVNWVARI